VEKRINCCQIIRKLYFHFQMNSHLNSLEKFSTLVQWCLTKTWYEMDFFKHFFLPIQFASSYSMLYSCGYFVIKSSINISVKGVFLRGIFLYFMLLVFVKYQILVNHINLRSSLHAISYCILRNFWESPPIITLGYIYYRCNTCINFYLKIYHSRVKRDHFEAV